MTLEFGILEKVIYELKEVVVFGENEHETHSIIENWGVDYYAGKMSSVLGKREEDARDAQERLKKFEEEQRQLEIAFEKRIAEIQLGTQRTEDARRMPF